MHYDRVTVVDHPMVQHKLSKLRNKNTSSKDFRALVRELAMFEGYEATRDLALEDVEVETPICKAACKQVAGKKMVIVPILRAGLGMVEGLQELMPSTFVGHLGMYRDPETHEPHEYYAKLPDSISQRDVLVVDPMLATGGSATAAIHYLREQGAFLHAVLGSGGDVGFGPRLRDSLCTNLVQSVLHERYRNDPEPFVGYYVAFFASAYLGVITRWIETGMRESSEEMALIAMRLFFIKPGESIKL